MSCCEYNCTITLVNRQDGKSPEIPCQIDSSSFQVVFTDVKIDETSKYVELDYEFEFDCKDEGFWATPIYLIFKNYKEVILKPYLLLNNN